MFYSYARAIPSPLPLSHIPTIFQMGGGGAFFSILDITLETLTDLIISQSYMARKETPAYCSFV